ncbi:hypothetical protein [Lactiplantibacillus paraxiangfangensis]
MAQNSLANLADTAHQGYPTALKTVLLLLLLSDDRRLPLMASVVKVVFDR